jgi:hypothetical protein
MVLIGTPVSTFLTMFAKKAGTGAGELFTTWINDLYAARKNRNGIVVVQDPDQPEIILEPGLPAEAWAELTDLVDRDALYTIPGGSVQIRYEPGRGWVRPW